MATFRDTYGDTTSSLTKDYEKDLTGEYDKYIKDIDMVKGQTEAMQRDYTRSLQDEQSTLAQGNVPTGHRPSTETMDFRDKWKNYRDNRTDQFQRDVSGLTSEQGQLEYINERAPGLTAGERGLEQRLIRRSMPQTLESAPDVSGLSNLTPDLDIMRQQQAEQSIVDEMARNQREADQYRSELEALQAQSDERNRQMDMASDFTGNLSDLLSGVSGGFRDKLDKVTSDNVGRAASGTGAAMSFLAPSPIAAIIAKRGLDKAAGLGAGLNVMDQLGSQYDAYSSGLGEGYEGYNSQISDLEQKIAALDALGGY